NLCGATARLFAQVKAGCPLQVKKRRSGAAQVAPEGAFRHFLQPRCAASTGQPARLHRASCWRKCLKARDRKQLLEVPLLLIIIWAIVKVAQSRAGSLAKLLWILLLLFVPLLGFILWLLLGPKGG